MIGLFMRETTLSAAATRCVVKALDDAKRSATYDERRFYLDQAAVYAHLAEEARQESGRDDLQINCRDGLDDSKPPSLGRWAAPT